MRVIEFGPGAFRLILASAVLVEHLSRFSVGKPAVMVFFMLSGYWVMRMYHERYSRNPRPLQVFYASRFLRVWLLYATVFLMAMASYFVLLGRYDPMNWLGLPVFGVATNDRDILGITWSLDIEMQFYAVLPLIWLFMSAMKGRGSWALFGLVILAVSAVGWAMDVMYGVETVAAYLPLFVVGAVIYFFKAEASRGFAAASVAAFFLAAVVAYAIPELRPFIVYGSDSVAYDKFFALLWALFLIPFVSFNLRQRSNLMDRHYGNLSYSLYLVHFPFIVLLRELLGRDFTTVEKIPVVLATFAVSIAVYAAFDMRYERMRPKLVNDLVARA